VPWVRTCPGCRAAGAVEVRTAVRGLKFWYCTLECGWACWRPPAPFDCPKCGAAMLWAHSRRSVSCPACGLRVTAKHPDGVYLQFGMIRVSLTDTTRGELRALRRTDLPAKVRDRVEMVLSSDAGWSAPRI